MKDKRRDEGTGTFPYIFLACPICQHRQVHQLWIKPIHGLREDISRSTITCDNCSRTFYTKEVLKSIVAVTPWVAVEKDMDDAEGYFAFLYINNLELLPEMPTNGWLSECSCATCKRIKSQYERLRGLGDIRNRKRR